MASDPRDPWLQETERDFEDVGRLTRAVVHYAKAFLIALPLWLLLLLFLPRAGLGEIPSLLVASLAAGGLAVAGARRSRRRARGAGRARLRWRPGTAGRLALLGLGVVVVLYLVLVLRAGG